MKKKVGMSVEQFLDARAKVIADIGTVPEIAMRVIGEITCAALARDGALTLDSLLADCSRQHEELGRQPNHRQSVDWHSMGAALAHLQTLKQET